MSKIVNDKEKIEHVKEILWQWASIAGDHHKAWVLDQIARAVYQLDYEDFIKEYNSDEEYSDWEVGIAP